jgi:hypothetical protein
MFARRLLLFSVLFCLLVGLSFSTTACSSECSPGLGTECCQDSDCPSLFACGPNYLCTRRCFAGKPEGCSAGSVCNDTGTGCVKSATSAESNSEKSNTDAGSSTD